MTEKRDIERAADPAKPVIELKGICKSFDGRVVLDDVSLAVEEERKLELVTTYNSAGVKKQPVSVEALAGDGSAVQAVSEATIQVNEAEVKTEHDRSPKLLLAKMAAVAAALLGGALVVMQFVPARDPGIYLRPGVNAGMKISQ